VQIGELKLSDEIKTDPSSGDESPDIWFLKGLLLPEYFITIYFFPPTG